MAATDLLDVLRQHEKLGQLIGRSAIMRKVFKREILPDPELLSENMVARPECFRGVIPAR